MLWIYHLPCLPIFTFFFYIYYHPSFCHILEFVSVQVNSALVHTSHGLASAILLSQTPCAHLHLSQISQREVECEFGISHQLLLSAVLREAK